MERGSWSRREIKKVEKGWESKIQGREGQGIFFLVKVHMSDWQAARGVQPKNLFNVCFTGRQEG